MNQTEVIVNSIVALYRSALPDHDCYLRFSHGFLSIADVIREIVPSSMNIPWPIDRCELSRTWSNLIVVPRGRRPENYIALLPQQRLAQECMRVPLDGRFIRLHTDDFPIQIPNCPEVSIYEREPAPKITHDVNISTIWNDWFRDCDDYGVRFTLPPVSQVYTLLLNQYDTDHRDIRYSITWIPHHHKNAYALSAATGFSGPHFRKMPVTCYGLIHTTSQRDARCIIWNCRGAGSTSFIGHLSNLLFRTHPDVLILTDTQLESNEASWLASCAGFTGVIHCQATCQYGGIWILWHEQYVTVTEKPSYSRCLHITVEPATC